MTLSVADICFSYGRRQVLHNVFLGDLKQGSLTALIGPNAAGKSTLFKCIAGLLSFTSGKVTINGRSPAELGRRAWNKAVCFMPQTYTSNAALTVFEVVLLARKNLSSWSVDETDIDLVADTLQMLNIEHLSEVFVGDLSGGQQQMVSIAQALIRTPDVFLLDEPTSALDLRHQLEIMSTIRDVTRERGIVCVVALHDLNLAARYADKTILMRQGQVVANGLPAHVLSSEEICETYGVSIELHETSGGHLTVAASL